MPGMNDQFDEIHEGDRLSAKWLNNLAGAVMRLSRPNRGRMRTITNWCGTFTIPEDDEQKYLTKNSGTTWNKGTTRSGLTIWETGSTPGAETDSGVSFPDAPYNRFANIGANKWIILKEVVPGVLEVWQAEC